MSNSISANSSASTIRLSENPKFNENRKHLFAYRCANQFGDIERQQVAPLFDYLGTFDTIESAVQRAVSHKGASVAFIVSGGCLVSKKPAKHKSDETTVESNR